MILPCQEREHLSYDNQNRIQKSFKYPSALPRMVLFCAEHTPQYVESGYSCEKHSGAFYDPGKPEQDNFQYTQLSFLIPVPICLCHRRQGEKRQEKIHQKIIDPDSQVEIREESTSHRKKGIQQEPSPLLYDSEHCQKACKDHAVLCKQHRSLGMTGKTAYVINEYTAPGRIIPKRDQCGIPSRETVFCQQIFHDQGPVREIVIMIQPQICRKDDKHYNTCAETYSEQTPRWESDPAFYHTVQEHTASRQSCQKYQIGRRRQLSEKSAPEKDKTNPRRTGDRHEPDLHLPEPINSKQDSPQ